MIFILTEGTFAAASEGSGDLSTALIAICHHGVAARHIIAPDPGVDAGSGESACGRWLDQQGRRVRRTLLETLRAGQVKVGLSPAKRHRIRVVPSGTDYTSTPPSLAPNEAFAVANLPLNVWFEDHQSDRAFLRRIVARPLGSRVDSMVAKGTLRFCHGGGSVLLSQLENLLEGDALRSWVMVDGDTDSKEDKDKKEALREVCRRKGMHLEVLTRREIENYLPLPAIDWWRRHPDGMGDAERERRAKAVEAMSPEERWQADMKEVLEPKVANLFSNDAVGWRPRWFDEDGSREEIERIAASLEERL